MSNYLDFLETKIKKATSTGIDIDLTSINTILFSFQKDIVKWAVKKGRAAIFLDTGLGKTFIQLEWARLLDKPTIIVAPLSVARQTVREAKKLDIDVEYIREQPSIKKSIYITNYEMIGRFDLSKFGAVVLDESSILKALDGKIKKELIKNCKDIPYRLACTATPAPNDSIELGNHAEFLGISSHAEMLATFFINANREHAFIIDNKCYRKKGSNKGGQEWRLKHHAEQPFFKWLSSWAITMTKPSDLGYSDDGFILPPLNIKPCFVNSDYVPENQLCFTGLGGIRGRSKIRNSTIEDKLTKLAEIVGNSSEQWIVWTGLQNESSIVTKSLLGSVEVKGSDNPDYKADSFEAFQDGKIKIIVTKPKIGGFGMNFQNSHNMIFFGLNDSWESWYQCIRRQWRYGQKETVNVYIIMSNIEEAIYQNILRKDAMAKRLRVGLTEQIKKHEDEEIKMLEKIEESYIQDTVSGKNWTALLGDSCERLKEIMDESIDLSVYSPPFEDLFTYSDSLRDLGNSKGSEEFFNHYVFIIREILRVTKSGRLTCVHTSDIPAMSSRDGYIGVKDFPGKVIHAYQKEGWIFFGRAFVQKNPQAQAIRTKAKGLLFVQMRKDSTSSSPALVDQILIFKKPGDNLIPVCPVENGEMDNEKWINWANGIWLDINESDTLQYSNGRSSDDEKHICPLQLGTIERCIKLYSNPGELVLTPFMGIGSEAYQAIKFGRKAIGIELKKSYFQLAVRNLNNIEQNSLTPELF